MTKKQKCRFGPLKKPFIDSKGIKRICKTEKNPPAKSVKTGEPLRIDYAFNTEKSVRVGSRFAQDIEPSGRYIIQDEMGGKFKLPNWKYGEATFKNPLVLKHKTTGHGGWKTDLSKMFGGKTGKSLTKAVKTKGHDAIVTIDGSNYSEIVIIKKDEKWKR